MPLPNDRDARNALPVWDGCIAYFPDVWAEIAKVSAAGNKQHALGGKLRWERGISTDHENKVLRHMLDHGAGRVIDTDGCYHLAKAAWRVLAALQLAIEAVPVGPPGTPGVLGPQGPEARGIAGPELILKLESNDPDQVGESDERIRADQKRGHASGPGQVAFSTHNPVGHQKGSG